MVVYNMSAVKSNYTVQDGLCTIALNPVHEWILYVMGSDLQQIFFKGRGGIWTSCSKKPLEEKNGPLPSHCANKNQHVAHHQWITDNN